MRNISNTLHYLFPYIYLQFDGNITEVTLEDLVPFTRYVFKIEACTVAGCTMSADSRAVETLKARKYSQTRIPLSQRRTICLTP